MRYGICIFPTAYSIQPAELAVAMEERGFESLWLPEHTHIPASRLSPWPGGAELPRMYYDVYDPFVSLAAAASVTKKLKLATGVTLACQHNPLTLAKTAATLDRLSGGRLLLGVGGGWNREELADHGRPFERRWKVLRETVEAMQALWRSNPAEYHGEFVDFAPAHSAPTPVQQPHPPIHVAGSAPHALKRVVRYGNGWVPIPGREAEGSLDDQLRELRRLARDAGRDPNEIEVSLYACPPKEEFLRTSADIGVARAVFALPSAATAEVLPLLDRYAALAAQGRPEPQRVVDAVFEGRAACEKPTRNSRAHRAKDSRATELKENFDDPSSGKGRSPGTGGRDRCNRFSSRVPVPSRPPSRSFPSAR